MRIISQIPARALALGCASFLAIALSGQSSRADTNLLGNAGFETPDASAGDVAAPSSGSGVGDWIAVAGNTYYTQSHALDGKQSGKMFGSIGLFQQTAPAANAADTFTATVMMLNASNDPLQGNEGGFINIDFLDGSGNVITTVTGAEEGFQLTSQSPQDVWTLEKVTAPGVAGTASVRVDLVAGPFSPVSGAAGGAVFVDDATLTETGVPEPMSLGLLGGGMLLLSLRRRRASVLA